MKMKIAKVSEMHEMDRQAIEKFGITGELLMENAGMAVFQVIREEIGTAGNRFVIFCGNGNNGGDGLVVARKLHSDGAEVEVVLLGDKNKYRGAARKNLEIVEKIPVKTREVRSTAGLKNLIASADAVVDAIFGTGLSRDVGGIYGKVIDLINAGGKPVFSVDIPSGINGDTGQIMGTAVAADFTVTFGIPKLGNLLYPGYEMGGKLYVSHISFPPSLYETESVRTAINMPLPLPPRSLASHKGDYGKVLFISGAASYLGAPYFAALSFLKAGGGLSYLAAPGSIAPFLAGKGSEIVLLPQKETETGSIALENLPALAEFAARVDMVVMGPGISLHERTGELVRNLAVRIECPLLIDGDGLTALVKDPALIRKRKAATILTPHPGEMARITGLSINEINGNRIEVLREYCRKLDSIIVLKTAHTLIGYPDGNVFVNTSGNPGMATAGSGDVLTGTIAAMYGLGFEIGEAVRMGVFMHGLAGDLAVADIGEDGLTAGDILSYLPEAMKVNRENFADLVENCYGTIFTV